MVLCFTKYTTKIYNKATIYANELILALFSPFDIKCKILTFNVKNLQNIFRASRRVSFPFFPKVALDNVCVWEGGILNTF